MLAPEEPSARFPAGHAAHSDKPLVPVYNPVPQRMQELELETLANCPAAQAMHWLWPADE